MRVTEKVVQNVKQCLTATVATQTESPWAAPTKTVEVQVNFVKKVIVATQTEEPENEWVSIFTACHWSNETHSHSNTKAYKVVKTNRTLLFFFL